MLHAPSMRCHSGHSFKYIYIYILPYAWCSIPSLLCVRTDGCVWEGSTAKRKANFKQRLKCQWKVVAAGLVHGCVVLLPTLPKREEPRAYSSWVFLHVTGLCLGTLLPPHCSGDSANSSSTDHPCPVYVSMRTEECPNCGLFTKQAL